ncbi:hypothetical protein EXIGLDRAFT_73159 [Exidia glandulosa HHB12029]|uniref:Uncharacterized protein n=1 Tax=Exidia glandulosa HHB12029 TaxID=1314781 RepID=A0A165HUX7_EXIGL|nr:hypothetical protein EXIGLDRAFT_73159 [Exidia glandulosa HHB12029]
MVTEAFHKARADMNLPRSRVLPPSKHYTGPDIAGSPLTPTRPSPTKSEGDAVSFIGSFYAETIGTTESRWSSGSGSIHTRPRGLSNPLPDSVSETELPYYRGGHGISRRRSEHDEPPIMVPQAFRLHRTSRSRGRSRSRLRDAAAAAAAFSSGESEDDTLPPLRLRTLSMVEHSSPKPRPPVRRYDTTLGGREVSTDDPSLSYRSHRDLDLPPTSRAYPVIAEDMEPRGNSNNSSRVSVSNWNLDDVLEDQVQVMSPAPSMEFVPPSRYSYRGLA